MQPVVTIISVVAIAAAIGGITNYLAIKMLFHPRKPIYIGNWKVPMTPGLIPKRKEQIARSLGKVVSEYLVTSEGIASALQKSELKGRLTEMAEQWLDAKLDSEIALSDMLEEWLGAEQWEKWRERLPERLQEWTGRGITWLWEERGVGALAIKQCLPGWNEDKKEQASDWASDVILKAIRSEVQSTNGEKLIHHLIGAFLDRAGGFMGALAGIFMDEDKLVAKVRLAALEQLEQPRVKDAVKLFLLKKFDELEEKTLQELIESFTEEDALMWVQERAGELLRWHEWGGRLYEQRLQTLLGPWIASIRSRIPGVVEWLLNLAAKYTHKAVQFIDLPRLVEGQVADFPVERVEQVVLSISGKEFRAITWLGAVLGGTIGLFQSLFFLFS